MVSNLSEESINQWIEKNCAASRETWVHSCQIKFNTDDSNKPSLTDCRFDRESINFRCVVDPNEGISNEVWGSTIAELHTQLKGKDLSRSRHPPLL